MSSARLQVPPNSDLTLGMVCVDKGTPGRSVWTMVADERFANPAGILQGGFVGAFADSAMVRGDLRRRRKVFAANAEIKVSFLAPVTIGTTLRCEAQVVAGGSRVAFVEATHRRRAFVARATSTYLFRDRGATPPS